MGYSTDFEGQIEITPPLNQMEVAYIQAFSTTRHMDRILGPYYVDPDESETFLEALNRSITGEEPPFGSDVKNQNEPYKGQPGLWCDFTVTNNGKYLHWNGNEKTYYPAEWIRYLIDHFIGSDPQAKKAFDDQRFDFLDGHMLNGVIDANDDYGDSWSIFVKNNIVSEGSQDEELEDCVTEETYVKNK